MVRLKVATLARFCPRLLIVALLLIIAAVIALANFTEEIERRGGDVLAGPGELRFSLRDAGPVDPNSGGWGLWSISYGWPLVWRQYILAFSPGPSGVLGQCYSAARLALNVALWLLMLAAPAIGCEWLLRRRRLRFRWSLRTMLVGIGLVAALCGWFAAARNRADIQDAIIAAGNQVWLERRGPRWLDLVGVDRYRRTMVGASVDLSVTRNDELEVDEASFKEKEEVLRKLSLLRDLQYLFIEVNDGSPNLADALSKLRQLRVLSVVEEPFFSRENQHGWHKCLVAIGSMPNLEHLGLGIPLMSESLAGLAPLTNLKSLGLHVDRDDQIGSSSPLLSFLPPLPRLEAIDLGSSYVGDRGLRYLARLPRLERLNLNWTEVTKFDIADLPHLTFDPGLAELDCLEHLNEIAVTGHMASATGLESLLALKRLNELHIGGPYIGQHPTEALALDDGNEVHVLQVEIDRWRGALHALRQANQRIVIDRDDRALDWPGVPREYETIPEGTLRRSTLYSLSEWKKGNQSNKVFWPQPVGGYEN